MKPIVKKMGMLLVVFFCLLLLWGAAGGTAGPDPRMSVVKIYSLQSAPDYDSPWNLSRPEQFSGSGCIIAGRRILTNAHMVSHATFIQVRRHGTCFRPLSQSPLSRVQAEGFLRPSCLHFALHLPP